MQAQAKAVRQAQVPLRLGVFFNGHRVPASQLHWHGGRLAFRLAPALFAEGPEQRLILTCNPVRPWKVGVPDRRELGLPIFSIEFTPLVVGQFARDPSRSLS